jgi:hypothetical protein
VALPLKLSASNIASKFKQVNRHSRSKTVGARSTVMVAVFYAAERRADVQANECNAVL